MTQEIFMSFHPFLFLQLDRTTRPGRKTVVELYHPALCACLQEAVLCRRVSIASAPGSCDLGHTGLHGALPAGMGYALFRLPYRYFGRAKQFLMMKIYEKTLTIKIRYCK